MYIGKTRSAVAVILLTIITCGIYGLYWLYVAMEDMNKVMNRDYLSSGLFLILSIVCPPFIYYVLYKADQGLVEVCEQEGVRYKENFILWLLLTLLLGIGVLVAMVQITDAFNNLWEKRSFGKDAPAYSYLAFGLAKPG